MSRASKMDRMEGDCLLGKMESKMYLADFSCFLAKQNSGPVELQHRFRITLRHTLATFTGTYSMPFRLMLVFS